MRLIGLATLVIAGAIIADLVAHPEGTSKVVNGVTTLWNSALRASAGQAVS